MRQSTAKTRMLVLGLLVPALVAVFLMVMFQMQVVNGDEYKEKVNSSSSYTQSIAAARGPIVDRNGEVLVSVRVEPTADGEVAHSATLKHDGSKENFEITVEDTVALF